MIDLDDFRANPRRYLQVCAERCDECLFTKHRIVGSRRFRGIIDETVRTDRHFVCHKHSIRAADSNGQVTWEQANICCRAFYDQIGDRVLVIRLAHMLGIVVFVNANGDPVAPPQEDAHV